MRNHSVFYAPHRQQQGVVLFVALIAMLVLTLGGVAIMRMLNSSTSLAGNIAFRQAALAQSDRGVNAAFAWIVGKTNVQLESDDGVSGYQSTRDANITDWTQPGPWAANTVTLPTLNGYSVAYKIYRLCNSTGAVNNPGQVCNTAFGTTGAGASNVGNSQNADAPQFVANLLVHYRVVVRVLGPRNTASYVQVMISRGVN